MVVSQELLWDCLLGHVSPEAADRGNIAPIEDGMKSGLIFQIVLFDLYLSMKQPFEERRKHLKPFKSKFPVVGCVAIQPFAKSANVGELDE